MGVRLTVGHRPQLLGAEQEPGQLTNARRVADFGRALAEPLEAFVVVIDDLLAALLHFVDHDAVGGQRLVHVGEFSGALERREVVEQGIAAAGETRDVRRDVWQEMVAGEDFEDTFCGSNHWCHR